MYIVNVCDLGGRYVDSPPAGYNEFISDLRTYDPDPSHTSRITGVFTKGKFMWWQLENGWQVWTTYGMSGQWVIGDKPRHSAVTLYLSSDDDIPHMTVSREAHFSDPRHFGTVKFSFGNEALEAKLATLGPDMLSDPPYGVTFAEIIHRKPNRTIVEALMDQHTVSGVGNYIKCEALFAAGISPHRTCGSLSETSLAILRDAIVDVMQRSYAAQGSTIHTYKNVDGSDGGFSSQLRVYGKKSVSSSDPVIKELTKDGRTTHWVPSIQS